MTKDVEYSIYISYSHADKASAEWLQGRLEAYSIPRAVRGTVGRNGKVEKKILPVFLDRTDFSAHQDLSAEIRSKLSRSASMVVICSPHAAKSCWVHREILIYKGLRPESPVLPIIVDGEPNASNRGFDKSLECFPKALRYRVDSTGTLTEEPVEPLAADVRPSRDGKRNALLKVVSGALGINYDALKRRDEHRQAIRRTAFASVLAAGLGGLAVYAWQRFDRGTLVAEAHPETSIIEVDETELGARIRNLSLRTGAHRLVVTAPDHHEESREVEVDRDRLTTTHFSLDPAFVWKRESTDIQGGAVLFPAGSDTALAHNELGRVAFLSTATGSVIGEVPTIDGNTRIFKELDLGSAVGKVIMTAVDREAGPEIIAIAESLPPRTLWTWHGPSSGIAGSVGLSIVALSAPDQPAVVAASGRDGVVHFLDGRTGQKIDDVRITSSPNALPPKLLVGASPGGPVLVAFWRITAKISPGEGEDGKPLVAVGIDPRSRTVAWRQEFDGGWRGPNVMLMIDEAPHVILWNDRIWQVIDVTTGQIRNGGSLKGTLLNGPTFFEISGAGTALLFQYKDPALAMEAVRASDGAALWQGPDRLNGNFQPRRREDGAILRTAGGLLLVHREKTLAAVDPTDGRIVWTVDGEPAGALAGDWDGDGRLETFVTMSNGTLLCLDGGGKTLWRIHLKNGAATPLLMTRSPAGGLTNDVIVHRHAGMIGQVHGPHVLSRQIANSPIRATPIIARKPDGRPIVIATAKWGGKTQLHAFDGKEGTRLWTTPETEMPDNRPPAIVDLDGKGLDEVVAIARPTHVETYQLLRYRLSDGEQISMVSLGFKGWFAGTPVVADYRGIGKNDVAFSTWEDQAIFMVDGRSGATLWRFKTGSPNMGGVTASDLNGDGRPDVLAASGDGHLYALRGTDGSLIWKAMMDPGFKGNGLSTPILAELGDAGEQSVVAISGRGRLYAVSARTGDIRWRSEVAGGWGVSGHAVVVGKDRSRVVVAPQGHAGLVAYEGSSGRELWRSPAGQPMLSSPLVISLAEKGKDAVFAVSAWGRAFLFDISSGRVIWEAQVLGPPPCGFRCRRRSRPGHG